MTDETVTAPERRTILTALAVVILLSALDQTIVSTAMPRIIERLQGLSMYAWVTTAYLLASTVSVPIYGRLSDLYGRKPILVFGIVIFVFGSALCGLAGEFGDLPLLGGGMTQLTVFRAVQGLGGGALMTVSFAVIADLYPPRERGRLFGMFGAIFGLATVIGPFVGGFFTDHGTVTLLDQEVEGWRWVFYVNLPLGCIALFTILFRMPPVRHSGRGRVDYLGAVLLIATFTPFLLALSFGGGRYAWNSPTICALFGTSLIACVVFLYVESRTEEPILSIRLFRERAFRVPVMAAFVMNMAFLGVVMFMPLYMQVVQGVSATQSGIALLPLMAAMVVTSVVSGRLVAHTGRYKLLMVAGAIVLVIGVATLMQITPTTSSGDLAWRLAITGCGLGPAQTLFNLVIQNAAPVEQLGSATGVSQFARQIGSTLGVAIFGTFLTQSLTAELPRQLPLLPGATQHQSDLGHAQRQAMSTELIEDQVHTALATRFVLIERAYHDDSQALEEVLADTRLPEGVKAPLRDGGLRARIHEQLEARAQTLATELRKGEVGRDRLLQDPMLSESLKQQLANVPTRALRDPDVADTVARLFRSSIMAKEDAMVAAATEDTLARLRMLMNAYGDRLVRQIETGTKTAFSMSIAHMLGQALWIVIAGLVLILFIPEVPLRASERESEAGE